MAAVDPDVGSLLEALSTAGLSDLARSAAARSAEPYVDDEDEGFRDRPDIPREDQVALAEKVVLTRLDRELATTDRLRELVTDLVSIVS